MGTDILPAFSNLQPTFAEETSDFRHVGFQTPLSGGKFASKKLSGQRLGITQAGHGVLRQRDQRCPCGVGELEICFWDEMGGRSSRVAGIIPGAHGIMGCPSGPQISISNSWPLRGLCGMILCKFDTSCLLKGSGTEFLLICQISKCQVSDW